MFKFAVIYSFLGDVCYAYTQAESVLELKKDRIARYKKMNEELLDIVQVETLEEAIKLLDIVQVETLEEATEAYLKHIELS